MEEKQEKDVDGDERKGEISIKLSDRNKKKNSPDATDYIIRAGFQPKDGLIKNATASFTLLYVARGK